ncbi:MAG: hypothetical protein ACRD4L_09325, partial [Pyrinomonadaceae bacterium]
MNRMNKIVFIILPSIVLLSGLFVSTNAQTIEDYEALGMVFNKPDSKTLNPNSKDPQKNGQVRGGVILNPNAKKSNSNPGTPVTTALVRRQPVPPWPADGNIPESQREQYVFYEKSSESYVVSYPEKLVKPDGSDQRMTPIKFSLGNGVKPVISTQIEEKNGVYNYTYQIQNEPSARLAINSIALVVNSESKVDVTGPPSSWSGGKSFPTSVARQLAIPGQMGGSFVSWYGQPEGEIISGNRGPDFQISSNFKPGFTTVYLQGGPATRFDSELPREVVDQLTPLISFEKDHAIILTFGPVYSETTSKTYIASTFRTGIISLVGRGLD